MRVLKFGIVAAMAALLAAPVSARTFVITEDSDVRPPVAGSQDLDDSNFTAGGFDLNSLAGADFLSGDRVEIYGRIRHLADRYVFTALPGTAFNVDFIFGGYELEAGGSVGPGLSGLVGQTDTGELDPTIMGKEVRFALLDEDLNEIDSDIYISNTTANSGISSSIFSGIGSGTYTLVVDGTLDTGRFKAAAYDIAISVVPLPAPALLLLAGMGGLVLVSRRRSA